MSYYAVTWSNGVEKVFSDMGMNKQDFTDWCWDYGHYHFGSIIKPVKVEAAE